MKKSKAIALILISAALSSCHKTEEKDEWGQNREKRVYMRSDSTAEYSRSLYHAGLWYYAFRPYGYYNYGSYTRHGYYSSGISENSNIGKNSTKSAIVRGGFGGKGFAVSS